MENLIFKIDSKNFLYLFLVIISGFISYFGYKYNEIFNLDLSLFCGDGFTECFEVTQRMILFHTAIVLFFFLLINIFLSKNSFLKNEKDSYLLGVLIFFNILKYGSIDSSWGLFIYVLNFFSLIYFLFFRSFQKSFLYISILLYLIIVFTEFIINSEIFYYNHNFKIIEKTINIILISLFITFTILQVLRIRKIKTLIKNNL